MRRVCSVRRVMDRDFIVHSLRFEWQVRDITVCGYDTDLQPSSWSDPFDGTPVTCLVCIAEAEE